MSALQLGDLGFCIFCFKAQLSPLTLHSDGKSTKNYKLFNCAADCWGPSVLKLRSNGAPMDALQLGDLGFLIFSSRLTQPFDLALRRKSAQITNS